MNTQKETTTKLAAAARELKQRLAAAQTDGKQALEEATATQEAQQQKITALETAVEAAVKKEEHIRQQVEASTEQNEETAAQIQRIREEVSVGKIIFTPAALSGSWGVFVYFVSSHPLSWLLLVFNKPNAGVRHRKTRPGSGASTGEGPRRAMHQNRRRSA